MDWKNGRALRKYITFATKSKNHRTFSPRYSHGQDHSNKTNMKLQLLLLGLLSFSSALPTANATCPVTPSPWPAASTYPSMSTLPDPFTYLDGKSRVASKDEWYQCRQPEILQFLQQYQYGFYPNHSAETVTATRSGNTITINIAAGGKTASFKATLNLPSAASKTAPVPVVIEIGGIDNTPYLSQGIAVVGFDYTTVSPDSNGKTGAFWALYNGRDIGTLATRFSFQVQTH